MLTVAFFGSGGAGSMVPLDAVAKRHRIVAVIRPAPSKSWIRRLARAALSRFGVGTRSAMASWARQKRVPLLNALSGRDADLASRLKEFAPDVICVSAFPWLLGANILETAGRASLNVHPSLLPRHRGPNPYFWVYYHNDRYTGVTVHRMNESADAGEILGQEAFDLPRGFAIDGLYAKNAEVGAELLVQVLGELEAGLSKPVMQDEASATRAPSVSREMAMVNFAEWDVERVWHFLAGLCPRRREPLRDDADREVRYARVLGYTSGDRGAAAGVVQRASFGWNLYCLGGSVQLADQRHGGLGTKL